MSHVGRLLTRCRLSEAAPRCLFIVFLLVTLGGCDGDRTVEPTAEALPVYSEYAGTFTLGPLVILEIEAVEDWIALDPPTWTGRPYLRKVAGDAFALDLPYGSSGQTVTFFRDAAGAVSGVELQNLDPFFDGQRFMRMPPETISPALLFRKGEPVEAARAALDDVSIDPDQLRRFAVARLISQPSRHGDTSAFLEVVSRAFPNHAGLTALYGYSLVSVGRRPDAKDVLEAALLLDPEEPNAKEALRRLTFEEPEAGEGYRAVLPFSLADAYGEPSADEVAAVREAWRRRDLSARDVEVVHTFEVVLDHGVFRGSILRHTLSERAHFGAVLVPRSARGSLPVLIEARSVDTAYSPMDVTKGTNLLGALGPAQSSFVVVIPALRGNVLIVGEQEFASDGDPSDAWDGATDDTLGFLNAALKATPLADPDRIAAYGVSRGGTLALLAGIRDPRIDLVLNVVGPVDHLEAMNRTEGWTKAELVADMLSAGMVTDFDKAADGWQTFDHFFDRVLSDDESFGDVRQRLIASSPLYFVETLPEAHSYYGAEDRSVPLANPRLLQARLELRTDDRVTSSVTVLPNRGHDGDSLVVRRDVTRRLVAWAQQQEGPRRPVR